MFQGACLIQQHILGTQSDPQSSDFLRAADGAKNT